MPDADPICPVCRRIPVSITDARTSDEYNVTCPRCGSFRMVRSALRMFLDEAEVDTESGRLRLGPWGSRRRANASAWVARNPGALLTTQSFRHLVTVTPPGVVERARELLRELGNVSAFMGERIELRPEQWLARTWSLNEMELRALIDYLEEDGLLEVSEVQAGNKVPVRVTPRGWARLDELTRNPGQGAQGFVAMWFSEAMALVYDQALSPAISNAGYKPHRVDRREYLGKVDDEIVGQIRQSRFVVADFTGHRPGVYWEAGFAAGLGLPVFFTCRESEMDGLHFDIRQYNCIDWADEADLLRRLRDRLLAVLGKGPLPAAGPSEPR